MIQGKAVLARMARVNGVELPEDYEIRQEVTASSAVSKGSKLNQEIHTHTTPLSNSKQHTSLKDKLVYYTLILRMLSRGRYYIMKK